MDNFINIVSVPAIATIVYWVINLIKYTVNESEKFKRLIPIVSAVLGAVIGCVAFYIAPGVIIADTVFTAIIIGGASGLTATGTNQIFKQLSTKSEEKKHSD